MIDKTTIQNESTQAETNAAILAAVQELRQEIVQLKAEQVKSPSIIAKARMIFGRLTFKDWLIAFLLLFVMTQCVIPFVGGGRTINPFPNSTRQTSLTSIAQSSPKDKTERRLLATGFREVSKSISEQTVTTLDQAKWKTQIQTNPVLMSKEWDATRQNLWRILYQCKNVSEYADICNEIANTFE